MYDSYQIAEKIEELARANNVPVSRVLAACDLNKNALNSMRSRGTFPRAKTLCKVADYFGVSTDYLIGLADTPEPLAPDRQKLAADLTEHEAKLLTDYRLLDERGKMAVDRTIEGELALMQQQEDNSLPEQLA